MLQNSLKQFIFLILPIFFFLSTRLLAEIKDFKSGKLHLDFNLSSINTKSNFEDDGNLFKSIGAEKSFNVHQINTQIDFNYNRNLNFYTGLGFANAISDDSEFIRNHIAPTKIDLGLQYFLRKKRNLQVIPELTIALPLQIITDDFDEAFADDGTIKIRLGLNFQKKIWKTHHSFSSAYNYRNNNFSHYADFIYNIKLQSSKFNWTFSLSGISTLIDDSFINDPKKRTSVSDRSNAGSLYTYSLNPSFLAFRNQLDYRLSKHTELGLSIETRFQGRNTAKGNIVSLNLKMNNLINLYSNQKLKRSKIQENINNFTVDQETYDESLFNEDQIDLQKEED